MILMREMIAARSCGRRIDLAQHAVDAVAHAQVLLERLDVDVRGARSTAREISRLTMRTTGASLEIAQALDVVLGAELALIVDLLDDLAVVPPRPSRRSSAASMSAGTPTQGSTGLPANSCIAPIV